SPCSGHMVTDIRKQVISELLLATKQDRYRWESSWADHVFLRACMVRWEHGEPQAWTDFVQYVLGRSNLTAIAISILLDEDYLRWDDKPVWAADYLSPH